MNEEKSCVIHLIARLSSDFRPNKMPERGWFFAGKAVSSLVEFVFWLDGLFLSASDTDCKIAADFRANRLGLVAAPKGQKRARG